MDITRAKEVLEYHISSNVLPYGEKPLNSTTIRDKSSPDFQRIIFGMRVQLEGIL